MYHVFEHYLAGERVYTQTMTPICEKYGLAPTELTVLMFLANNPALDTASDIVKCRSLAKSHVSLSVGALEARGLLTKAYQNGNRRSIHLHLTERAAPIVNDGRKAQASFVELLFRDISMDERDILTQILQKIDQNMKASDKDEKKTAGAEKIKA